MSEPIESADDLEDFADALVEHAPEKLDREPTTKTED
jgi:hypothetical protein